MISFIFESAINLLQGVLVTAYLVKCLGCKKRFNSRIVCIAGTIITFIYLMISNYIVYFEGAAIYIYMIYSFIFSLILLNGTILEKIFYNVLMICCLACSSLLGCGMVSLVVKKDFLNAVPIGSAPRYVGATLVQIILIIFLALIIKLKKLLMEKDDKYMAIMTIIPAVSVIVCCFLVYRTDKNYEINVIYTFIALTGVVIVNIISILLLIMEHRLYEQKIQQQVMLSAYQQKEKDIESILDMQRENSKQRHDIKNVVILIKELIQDGKYDKAVEMIDKYNYSNRNNNITEIVSDNIVLNYLLNRKISQCHDSGIDMCCYVLGSVTGIDDMDMYILLENLCDNAIESAIQCSNALVRLQISEDNDNMYIDIGNSTRFNVLESNPDMNTIKQDKGLHGFGLMNIRDVINKYNGSISYEQQGDNYLMCRCKLHKETNAEQ